MCNLIIQSQKDDLNRFLVPQTQSIYNLSEDIAKGRIPELAPPFKSYQAFKGDIISYCMDLFVSIMAIYQQWRIWRLNGWGMKWRFCRISIGGLCLEGWIVRFTLSDTLSIG